MIWFDRRLFLKPSVVNIYLDPRSYCETAAAALLSYNKTRKSRSVDDNNNNFRLTAMGPERQLYLRASHANRRDLVKEKRRGWKLTMADYSDFEDSFESSSESESDKYQPEVIKGERSEEYQSASYHQFVKNEPVLELSGESLSYQLVVGVSWAWSRRFSYVVRFLISAVPSRVL